MTMVRSVVSPRVAQHRNPIPSAAVHRGLLVTSAVLGRELETDEFPQSKERQFELAFKHLVAILEDAGATLQDVVKVDLHVADKADRPLANSHWLRLWPDETRRPARQVHEAVLPNGCCVQVTAMAVLENQR